jgi:zinc transport system substrate-binding protein
VKGERIPVVFKCDLSAGKLADTIAEATGAKVLTLYSAHTLSKLDFEAGETYLSLMERNLEALKEALN